MLNKENQMNLNNRKIKVAYLHESFQLVGVAVFTKTVESMPGLELDMTKVEGGVHIRAKKGAASGECFVPDANCKMLSLFPESN